MVEDDEADEYERADRDQRLGEYRVHRALPNQIFTTLLMLLLLLLFCFFCVGLCLYLGGELGHEELGLDDHEEDAHHGEHERIVGYVSTLLEEQLAFAESIADARLLVLLVAAAAHVVGRRGARGAHRQMRMPMRRATVLTTATATTTTTATASDRRIARRCVEVVANAGVVAARGRIGCTDACTTTTTSATATTATATTAASVRLRRGADQIVTAQIQRVH